MPITPPSSPEDTFFQRLTNRLAAMATTPYAIVVMALVAVVDGFIFPVPPFAVLVPMVLARPKRAWLYAGIGVVASFVGGLLGYALGHGIKQGLVAAWQINPELPIHFGFSSLRMDTTLRQILTEHKIWLVLACSILPTPFKIVAIGSGMVGVPLPVFMLAALIGRSIRFFLVTLLLLLFGKTKWWR